MSVTALYKRGSTGSRSITNNASGSGPNQSATSPVPPHLAAAFSISTHSIQSAQSSATFSHISRPAVSSLRVHNRTIRDNSCLLLVA
eukprot:SAG22_NODE_53_length_24242_cov_158.884231_24_plen_87_part_00